MNPENEAFLKFLWVVDKIIIIRTDFSEFEGSITIIITIIKTSSYIAHFTILSQCALHKCPGHCANYIPVIFLSSLGSIQPRAAVALRRLFQTQYQPLPSQVPICTHLYPWVKRSNYSKVSCSRTQVS